MAGFERHLLSTNMLPKFDPGEDQMYEQIVGRRMSSGGADSRPSSETNASVSPTEQRRLTSALSRLNPLPALAKPFKAIYERYLWAPDGSDRDGSNAEKAYFEAEQNRNQ